MSLLRKVLVRTVAILLAVPEATLQGILLGLYVRGYTKRRTLLNWTRLYVWSEK